MRRLATLTLLLLLAVLVSACASPASQTANTPITPGTRTGNFVFTKADTGAVSYVTMMDCPIDQSTKARSCVLRVGTKTNIGKGFYDDDISDGRSLDDMWSQVTNEMLVDGRKVDLQAFGYVDTPRQGLGTVRFPNIMVVADKTGPLTVRYKGTFNGAPFDENMVLTFTATGT